MIEENKLAELMKRKDRGAKLAQNVLTRAFRDLLQQGGIDHGWLDQLMNVYLRNNTRQLALTNPKLNDPKEYATQFANSKGNLKKELERNEATFKVFMKMICLLRLKEFQISFSGVWHDGLSFENRYHLDTTDDTNFEVTDDELQTFWDTLAEERISIAARDPETIAKNPKLKDYLKLGLDKKDKEEAG